LHKQLTRIAELKQQLIGTGYHPTQFNDMIREVIGNVALADVTEVQGDAIIEALEYYCDFSEKCRKKEL